MTIYKTDDYNWHYSDEWDATDRMARGEISPTGKKPSPLIDNKGLEVYTMKDMSMLTEKERSALGLWHYVETQEGGIKMYSGLKINPHRWEPNFYQYPQHLKLTPGTIILFTPDGKCNWLKIDMAKRHGNSLEGCLMPLYTKLWGDQTKELITTYENYRYLIERATDRWLRDRKEMAIKRGKSASTVHKYPHYYLFDYTISYKNTINLFATVHTLGNLCRLINPGQIWEQASPAATVFQEPVMNLSLAIGVPKWLEPGDYEGLLREGLLGEIRFLDSGFPFSNEQSRLFELFKISVFMLGKRSPIGTHRWRQLLGAVECPTTGVLRFPLLREGTFLSSENLRDLIRKGNVKRLRYHCQNISAFQNRPIFPPMRGAPSHVPFVEVAIGKPSAPDIDFTEGVD